MTKQYIVAFTGARPSDLGGYDWYNKKNKNIRKHIKKQLRKLFDLNEYDNYLFRSGMALGIDQFVMDVLIELKAEYEDIINIEIEACVPFKLQYVKWNEVQQAKYHELLRHADIITYVDTLDDYKDKSVEEGKYSKTKLHLRNHYMIDDADLLMAYPIEGKETGGTVSAIKYALANDKKVFITEISNNKK